MGDVAAVMDAARSESAVLFGYSEGGPMAILHAATHPERVQGLVIYSSYARRLWAPDYPWGFRPEERARYAAQLEQDWAWEADMRHMCPNADEELAAWWGQRCRAATSPGAARALIEMNSLVDVRDTPRCRPGSDARPAPSPRRRLARRGGPLPRRAHPRRAVRRARRRGPLRRGRPRPDPRPGRGLRALAGVLDAFRVVAHHPAGPARRGADRPCLGAWHPPASGGALPRRTRGRGAAERAGLVRRPCAGRALCPRGRRARPEPPAGTCPRGCTPPR